ncbi:hypothetical protein C8J47_0205 [Sphingomonas sp. PP-F2F-G114-C0414]|uniref:hypothetical protein n=1 Tax=Sphingomonas sp. PP-F2F-G114-C0414 TaxID=2135662 RepID=UPI000F12965A|nr:hypothetical protein [Sphingomonas sp. PP-F2F-G114-C0414]RMB36635.1 hypothetical protein C8J47_0205 [Sphingomonas sp. PP-F2F-G114-C0414]
MMTRAAPTQVCQLGPPPRSATCSRKREQVTFPIAVVRMMRLDTAAGLLGKGKLADELCIRGPTLNFKINGDRGTSVSNIKDAAAARESRGERLPAHARKLREAIQ